MPGRDLLVGMCRINGWQTADVARLCGVQRRAVERWLDGTREVSAPALRLLVLVDQVPDVRAVLDALDADAGAAA